MSIPPPDERYTWPTSPSAPASTSRSTVISTSVSTSVSASSSTATRRQGAVAGTVFAVAAVWGTVFRGVEMPEGLALLVVGIVASAAAMSAPRLRTFAQGFLLACLVAGPVALVLLVVLLVAFFATMGP